MASNKDLFKQPTSVDEFLENASKIPAHFDLKSEGRLIFAMDATASREPCWDIASKIQADMFSQTSVVGKLQIQLCYYHGYNEFVASNWTQNALQLQEIMTTVRCKAGQTQLKQVFEHTLSQTKLHKIDAMVFVGDCMDCLLYTSPSPRDVEESRMPSSA